MASEAIGLAIIGTGGMSRRHVSAMADLRSKGLDGFVVTAVCDVNKESVQTMAQQIEERLGLRPAVSRSAC